jgi:hypothetical protein
MAFLHTGLLLAAALCLASPDRRPPQLPAAAARFLCGRTFKAAVLNRPRKATFTFLWFYKNEFIVNIRKNVISFLSSLNRHSCRPQVTINSIEIAYSSNLKILGLFITEDLAWNVHIHFLCVSMSKVYYMIKSLREVMSTHMLWGIYGA